MSCREEELAWEDYLYAGENGLLTMLVTLRWWWDEVHERNELFAHTEWMLALEDVYWVIEQVSSVLRYVIHS